MLSRREMPSAGGARFVAEGSEEAAEVKESVKVLSKDGNVAVAAMVWCLTVYRKFRCADDLCNGNFSRLGLGDMQSPINPIQYLYLTPILLHYYRRFINTTLISSILEAIETVSYAP